MSQPFNRNSNLEAAGPLDEESGQFWVGNPWAIVDDDHNLSAFERNAAYLSKGGKGFGNVSFLSGTDSDGDSRSVVPVDLNGDGMLDLMVRQSGGGALRIFANQFPKKQWLRVSLQGVKSNRQGIGARIVVETKSLKQTRELLTSNTFSSQKPDDVYFGLGDETEITNVTIHWPSGEVQTLNGVAVNQHVRITEGVDKPKVLSVK